MLYLQCDTALCECTRQHHWSAQSRQAVLGRNVYWKVLTCVSKLQGANCMPPAGLSHHVSTQAKCQCKRARYTGRRACLPVHEAPARIVLSLSQAVHHVVVGAKLRDISSITAAGTAATHA